VDDLAEVVGAGPVLLPFGVLRPIDEPAGEGLEPIDAGLVIGDRPTVAGQPFVQIDLGLGVVVIVPLLLEQGQRMIVDPFDLQGAAGPVERVGGPGRQVVDVAEGLVAVLLPVGGADGDGDVPAGGRDFDHGRRLEHDHVAEGRPVGGAVNGWWVRYGGRHGCVPLSDGSGYQFWR
jgi:hypothetical protein